MKTEWKYSSLFWIIGLLVLGIGWFVVFFRFSNSWDIQFHSAVARYWVKDGVSFEDISVYSHILTYPLYHVCIGFLYKSFGINENIVVAVVLTLSNVISVILFRKLFTIISEKKTSYIGDICSLCIMLFMPICSALTDYRIYARQCGPNPLHNPTIIFVRPFGIATCIFFGLFIEQYRKNSAQINWKYLFGFGIMSLLSVLAKPSYAFVFLPAMGILVLLIMISEKKLKCGFLSFVAVLPSVIIMLAQYLFMREKSSEVAMHFQFGGFSNFSLLEIIAVSISSFPVIFFLCHKNFFSLDQQWSFTALLALFIGWVQMFFLSDGSDGNFSWGYDLAIAYATMVAIASEIKRLQQDKIQNRKEKLNLFIRDGMALVFFLCQIASGVIYIFRVCLTGSYWI